MFDRDSLKIYNFDFSQAAETAYFDDQDRVEVCLKGLIGAFDIVREKKCYVAMTNLPMGFIDTFRRISVLIGVKIFPQNFQLCLQENSDGDGIEKRMIMLGGDFAQALENAYVLALEHGVLGVDKEDCLQAKDLKRLLLPEEIQRADQHIKTIGAAPFDVILKCKKDDERSLFERQIKEMAEGALDEATAGYKIDNTHMRLGSKVHIESFYEMSFLFYRTTIANRIAFMLLKQLLGRADEIDLKNDPILFYGYASYSKAILTSVTEILQAYRRGDNETQEEAYVAFASFQHNLMLESEETQMYFGLQSNDAFGTIDERNCLKLNQETKIVQIVPISSTLTTFDKMWEKFVASLSEQNTKPVKLVENYTIFWVVDAAGDLENGKPSDIEKDYWINVTGREIETRLSGLKTANNARVHFCIRSKVVWNDPLRCKLCYPEYVISEVPLVETDPTSTVPTQQIRYKNSAIQPTEKVSEQFCTRFRELSDCVFYDHVCRRQNHYQFYVDTQRYFYKVKNDVRSWLSGMSQSMEDNMGDPTLHIIFSPEHNTNVGFAQYVNTYYFKGLAEIVSINVDKQFRSNFVCEHAALKQMIKDLYEDNEEECNPPVRFYFVDDTIITGETFEKANGLLQSLVPGGKLAINLFSKVFLLIDRMSEESKQVYVTKPKENFLSFLHLDVSNTRTHGDSCIGCKLKQDAEKMFKRSATRNMAYYWANKAKTYKKKEYDNQQKMARIDKEKSYRMLLFSHVLQNIIVKQNRYCKNGEVYDCILQITLWLLKDTEEGYGQAFGFEQLLEESRGITGIKFLLKTICRPFFSYDFTIKKQMYVFFLLISELLLGIEEKDIVPTEVKEKEKISFIFDNHGKRIRETEKAVSSIKPAKKSQ